VNTKQKRKYGEVRKGAETTAGTNESVFDKFLSPTETKPTPPSQTSQTTTTRLTSQGDAPSRDFARVPNSLTREVIPAKEFRGKSKQIYDCLYSLTRGAITPKSSVRLSRPKLMKRAGIGARVTFDTNVAHLISIGLLQVRQIAGEHEGNEYTVFLPEERTLTSLTSHASHAQDQDRLVSLESSQTRHTLTVDSIATSSDPNTSFNTKKEFDDEAARQIGDLFKDLEREVIGKNSASVDQWREIREVLLAEIRIAAARTSVSSVPSFLAEHLRRRLWKMDKKQAAREGKELPDQTATPIQANPAGCPDCNGSGWWYPNGLEKGVAKCKHENLTQPG
jgi:hypothetical protein